MSPCPCTSTCEPYNLNYSYTAAAVEWQCPSLSRPPDAPRLSSPPRHISSDPRSPDPAGSLRGRCCCPVLLPVRRALTALPAFLLPLSAYGVHVDARTFYRSSRSKSSSSSSAQSTAAGGFPPRLCTAAVARHDPAPLWQAVDAPFPHTSRGHCRCWRELRLCLRHREMLHPPPPDRTPSAFPLPSCCCALAGSSLWPPSSQSP